MRFVGRLRPSPALTVVALAIIAIGCGLVLWMRGSARGHLHRLAEAGDLVGVLEALRSGADPNELESDRNKILGGYTPLMYAAQSGNIECLRVLIEAGGDVNAEDWSRVSVLSYAIGRPDMVELLLSRGALADRCSLVEAWGVRAISPLARAVEFKLSDSLRQLLDAGVDPASQCFHYALFEYLGGWAPMPLDDTITAMLVVHTKGELLDQGPVLLWRAALSGAVESTRRLLEFGVAVNATTPSGMTPLMGAAEGGSVEVAQILLDHGAERAVTDPEGKTALEYVSRAEAARIPAHRTDALRRMLAGNSGVTSPPCSSPWCAAQFPETPVWDSRAQCTTP